MVTTIIFFKEPNKGLSVCLCICPLLAYTHGDTREAFGVQSVSTFLKSLSLLIYTDEAWLDLGKAIYRVVSSALDNR